MRGIYQQQFLRVVADEVKEVLKGLLTEVLPLYTAIPLEIRRENARGPKRASMTNNAGFLFGDEPPQWTEVRLSDLVLWTNVEHHAERSPHVAVMRDALVRWAKQFNLDAHWIRMEALATLYHWEANPPDPADDLQWWGFYSSRFPVLTAKESQFDLSLQDHGWDLEYEPWGEFRERIGTEIKRGLKEYRTRLEDTARARGWAVPREVRQPAQFRWLALYQVKGLSPVGIIKHLKDSELNEDTIQKAVKSAAELIDLPLRRGKQGRKPKEKT